MPTFVDTLPDLPWERVPGTAVFLFKDAGATPPALLVNLRHNKVLHENVLLCRSRPTTAPRAEPGRGNEVTKVGPGMWQVVLTFGFIDNPDVP